ncbi:hypothetical protein TCAL_16388 [Tigriopus californicus]|uniref:Uncharacterized protein n=2 Tax=Tigriopus californicus TaxID=6832 RepID=A0A553NZR5_TIGCA|nr:hypothetical protein TCAL_16388 [Tigriopus californicus]
MKETTLLNSNDFPCIDIEDASFVNCVFQKTKENFKRAYAAWKTACSIPQSQIVEDAETSNVPLCTSKVDSDYAKDVLMKEVLGKVGSFVQECPRDCTTRTYQIKERQDFTTFDQTNLSSAYFIWQTTNYVQEKEYYIYDVTTIVGIVGGSLGLFLGLSCRGVLDQVIDLVWTHYPRRIQTNLKK